MLGWQHKGREIEFVFDDDGPQTGQIFAIDPPSEGVIAIMVEKANDALWRLSCNGVRFILQLHSL